MKRTKAIMLIGAGEGAAAIRYATGFAAPDPFLFLAHAGRKYIVVSPLEAGRARRVAAKARVYTPNDLCHRGGAGRMTDWALALMKKVGIQSVWVNSSFPVGLADWLRRKGRRVSVLKTEPFPGREKKTARELKIIRAVQQAAVRAMQRAMSQIARAKPDSHGTLRVRGLALTAEQVRRAIDSFLFAQDCIGTGTIVSHGPQSADPHERGSGPLRAGEPIVIDIFPQSMTHGYWGDLTRTVVKGGVTQAWNRVHRAVKAAHAAALSAVRGGIRFRSVQRKARDVFSKRGYRTGAKDNKPQGFIHSIGHGVGLAVHEEPFARKGNRLRTGNVVTIEPGLYFPGKGGVRIEDLVVVTARGHRILVKCPYSWEL